MLATAENVVERMNKLMLQLRTGATPVDSPRPVDLGPVIRRVCAAKAGPGPAIALEISGKVVASGHEDRLEHVIGHLIQNALDATADRGSIAIRLTADGDHAVVEVTDTGVGMTREFVRERLYKPFETTKGQGMGIGVYESSQYVIGIGGQLLIDSTPGKGTRVRVLLPLATGSPIPSASKQEVA
jgi:signal transduction histidine kinase